MLSITLTEPVLRAPTNKNTFYAIRVNGVYKGDITEYASGEAVCRIWKGVPARFDSVAQAMDFVNGLYKAFKP